MRMIPATGTAGKGAAPGTTPNRNLLSDKELLYLKDFLSWELLAIKKLSAAAGACQDANLRTLLDAAGKRHQQHYNTLLSHLQRHAKGGAA
jgi:hypothetical protein